MTLERTEKLSALGFEALIRELGPAGAIRFIQQYETGQGITPVIVKNLPNKSVREIGAEIIKARQSKAK
jgi:hypothetical protein